MSDPVSRPTLLRCFLHWERRRPDEIYMTQPYPDGRVIDYRWGEVGDQARRMAAHIKSLNLPSQSKIALLGKNSAHWVMADLAIWMAGHVTVPLYPTLNADTARFIVEHSEAKLLFLGKLDGETDTWNDIQKGLPTDLPMIGLPMSPRADIPQWQDLIARCSPLKKVATPEREDLATIVYTSGSTGRPKGVMHSHVGMTAAAAAINALYTFTHKDRMLSYLPLAHVAERAAVESTSLYFGFQIFFADNLSTFQTDLKRARPTIFFSVPRLWTKFYQAINQKISPRLQRVVFSLPIVSSLLKKKILHEMGLGHVRAAITGSAPLPANIIEWYRGLGLELLEVYGMSENFGTSHASRFGEVRIGYVGTCVPGVQCRIAENHELEVKSPGQMMGYYKAPEKTAEEMTSDGYFKTGDRGELDEMGRLRITGRVKELFKTSKGKYVAPAPIENKLGSNSKIEAVCVTGSGQPQPFALGMLSLDAARDLQSGVARRDHYGEEFDRLLVEANATLEDHEKLDYLVIVKEQWTLINGFLTPTMKIKRNVLEDRYLGQADHWRSTGQRIIWE